MVSKYNPDWSLVGSILVLSNLKEYDYGKIFSCIIR